MGLRDPVAPDLTLLAAVVALGVLAAEAPAAEPQTHPANRVICVLLDSSRIPPDLRTSFLDGVRRPFLLPELPIEAMDAKHRWHDVGSLRNVFRLAGTPCVDARLADSLQLIPLSSGGHRDSVEDADFAVRIRLKSWSQMTVDYIWRPGDPPLSPVQRVDPVRLGLEVAICAPDSVTRDSMLVWTPMGVWWRENPSDPARRQEIHGWMAGMAAMQIACRRFGLLPDSLDLVFESRGRNH